MADRASRRRSAAPRVWRLPLAGVLAVRYLRSTRRNAFVSFLSAVAAGGIGLGVAALLLSLGALAGMQEAIRDEVVERTPQLEVELAAGAAPGEVAVRLAALPGVEEVQQLVKGRGWLRSGPLVEPVELVGYSGPVPRSFPGARGAPPGLYVSDRLAERWVLETGQPLSVISPRPTLTPFGPQPRIRSLTLAGSFHSGRTEEVERVALPLAVAESLLGGSRHYLDLTARDLDLAVALVPEVEQEVPEGSRVLTWRQLNRPLFFALRLEKTVMFVAVSLITLVAALALVADLALVITSKRGELAMLSAMGATGRELRNAFVLLGTLLGGVGMSAGAATGWALARILDHYHLLRLESQAYFLDYVPFRLEKGDVAAVLALTLLLAVASSLYVAQRVTRMRPVEELRR